MRERLYFGYLFSLLMMEVGFSNYGHFSPFPFCKGTGKDVVIKRESLFKVTAASIACWEVFLQALFFSRHCQCLFMLESISSSFRQSLSVLCVQLRDVI